MLRVLIALLESVARRVLRGRKGSASRISCDRDRRSGVVSALRNGLFRRVADGDHTLRWVSTGIEPCDITIRESIEASDGILWEVCAGHFVRKRPCGRCGEQRTVH